MTTAETIILFIWAALVGGTAGFIACVINGWHFWFAYGFVGENLLLAAAYYAGVYDKCAHTI